MTTTEFGRKRRIIALLDVNGFFIHVLFANKKHLIKLFINYTADNARRWFHYILKICRIILL